MSRSLCEPFAEAAGCCDDAAPVVDHLWLESVRRFEDGHDAVLGRAVPFAVDAPGGLLLGL